MNSWWLRTLSLSLVVFFSIPHPALQAGKTDRKSAAADAPPAAIEQPVRLWPPTEVTVGFQSRDSEIEGLGDLLIPVWHPGGTGLLFVNPRTAFTDHDAEEYNVGIGYRQLLEKHNVILGANAYYDYRDTGYAHYDQWGVGLEILSPWIDARANYYDPDDKTIVVASETETTTRHSTRTTTDWQAPYATGNAIVQDYALTRTLTTVTTSRTYEQFEQALGGYDWEIGVRLPLPTDPETLEARLFGGYYDFDNDFDGEAKGWKARAELRVLAAVFLDAGIYENDDLTGSDWFAGARLSVPLDLAAVSRGRNPFATARSRRRGDTRDLAARLTEMVMRDPQVRLDTSKFIENPTREEQATTRSSQTRTGALTVMDDIQFVDADRAIGDGTGEQPFATIQEGVDYASGERNVYVFAASSAYDENVVLTDDITLWGSGSLIPAYGGRTFGSGVAPVVDGVSMGPAVTLANRTAVRGFTIRNTDAGGAPIMAVLPSLGARDISRVGILGNDATELTITENTLSGNTVGALFGRQGDFDLHFSGNLVQNNDHTGLEINATGSSGTFNLRVENSLFQNNGGDGANIIANTYDTSIIQVRNSQFNDNSDGLSIGQFDTDLALAVVSGSTGNGNNGMGLGVSQLGSGVSLANISGSTASHNGANGIWITQNSLDTAVSIIGLPEGLGPDIGALTAEFGLALPPEVATLLSATGPVTAEHNVGSGVVSTTIAQNDLSLGAFFDTTARGNTDDGLTAHVINIHGIAASIGGSSANWADILQLADNVIGPAFGINLPLSITGNGQMQLNNNGRGMNLNTQGETASISAFAGLDAIGNAATHGVLMATFSPGMSISALARATLSGNAGDGLRQLTDGTDAAISLLADVTASNNGGHGIQTFANSSDGTAALLTLSTDAIRPLGAWLGDLFIGTPITVPGSVYGPVVASGNAGMGIDASVDGDDLAIAALLDTQTSGNIGGDGIHLNVTSDAGDAYAAILSSDALCDLLPTALGIPPIPYTPVGPVESTFNGGSGIFVDQSAEQDAYLFMLDVNANDNTAQGLVGVQNANNGDALAILAGLEAMVNNTGGIQLNQTAAQDALSAVVMADIFGNNGIGLHVNQTAIGGGAFSLLGGVDSIGNNALGIRMDLSGGDDAVAVLTAVNSSQNVGGDGMNLNITAEDEAVLLAGDGALTLVDTNSVGGMGADLLDLTGALIPQGEVVFNGNTAGLGLYAALTSANGDVMVSLDGAEANDNGGNGILLDLTAANGSIYSDILNTEASHNGTAGLRMDFTGTGTEALVGLEDVTTQDNANSGISIVESYTGTVNIRGDSLVSTDNTGNGVRVRTDGPSAVVDFGGGALGSLGQSAFFGNGNRDMREAGPGGAIVAQSNWWGTATPILGQFAGSVDYSNWLLAAP